MVPSPRRLPHSISLLEERGFELVVPPSFSSWPGRLRDHLDQRRRACCALYQSPVRETGMATTRRPRGGGGRGRRISWLCGSTCEQSALLGPVQWQIEFGLMRRGELDGLPALQARVDQLWA